MSFGRIYINAQNAGQTSYNKLLCKSISTKYYIWGQKHIIMKIAKALNSIITSHISSHKSAMP